MQANTGGVILLFGERYWGKPRQDESGSPRRSIQGVRRARDGGSSTAGRSAPRAADDNDVTRPHGLAATD